MTTNERSVLDLDLYCRLTAMAARNGFDVATQSPFRDYHGALLRAAGGRGTKKHAAWMKQVAKALGSTDGLLQRGMDHDVERKVGGHLTSFRSCRYC
jgi:hypothetical protein